MTKHVELSNRLQALELATRKHQRVLSIHGEDAAYVKKCFDEADRAEKRIFTLFEWMQRKIDGVRGTQDSLRKQLAHVVSERDALKRKLDSYVFAPAAPVDPLKVATVTAPVEPFDVARARAGEPIQVLMSADRWIEKPYIGVYKSPHGVQEFVVYVHDDKPDYAPLGSVRMKPTTQTVQMFANVFKDEHGARAGALYGDADMARKFVGTVAESIKCVGVAIPVNVTVAA
jgi:hypothetical protein